MNRTDRHLGNVGFFALGLLLGFGAITVYLLLIQTERDTVSRGEEEFIIVKSPDGEIQITAADDGESNVANSPSESIDSALEGIRPFSRGLTLHRFLSNATTTQVQHFFLQAEDFRPVSLRDEIQEATIATLSLLSPSEALALLEDIPDTRRRSLISIVFFEFVSCGRRRSSCTCRDSS